MPQRQQQRRRFPTKSEQERKAYWAKRRAQERAVAQERSTTDPNHPHNHHCTERTIRYGTSEHVCQVCGRTWTLERVGGTGMVDFGFRYRVDPVTTKMPPLREDTL